MDGTLARRLRRGGRIAVLGSSAWFSACGGGGGAESEASPPGGGVSEARAPIVDLTGTWNVTERGVSDCPNLATYTVAPFRIEIEQNGNAVTIAAPSGTFAGAIEGDRLTWSGSYPSGTGTATITSMHLTVAFDGNTFSGSGTWRWSDGSLTCAGTSQSINANRLPGAGHLPAVPNALSGAPQSLSSVTLIWNDNSDNESGFKLERRTAGGTFAQVALLDENTSSYVDTHLDALTSYDYRVRAYNATGDSLYSNVFTVTTLSAIAPAPIAPTGLALIVSASGRMTLRWIDNSTDETSFRIERRTGDDGRFGEIAFVASNVTSYEDVGLAANTRYFYRVRARNLFGDSGYSNVVDATTLAAAAAPDAPSSLTAMAAPSAVRIDLRWSDNSMNETGFKIERSVSASDGFTQIAITPAGVATFSDTFGLQRDTRYFYRVRATNTSTLLDSMYSNTANARTIN